MGTVTRVASAAAVVLLLCAPEASAGLLTSGAELQIEGWLGEGDLDFTDVFTKMPGDGQTSLDFHNAVDGVGRTITLLEVRESLGNEHQIIGGYNPQSWDSVGAYHITPSDAERTAFLFNLDTSTIQRQKLTSDPPGSSYGEWQTYNRVSYGPTFGGGHDLFVETGLTFGHGYQFSYGTGVDTANIIGKTWAGFDSIEFSTIEVYTLAPRDASAVPEPTSLALLSVGTLGMGLIARRRRQSARDMVC